jgi:NAD(P)-dependent dehydrogenase (short-subunit alcohol dehydrogenase family)
MVVPLFLFLVAARSRLWHAPVEATKAAKCRCLTMLRIVVQRNSTVRGRHRRGVPRLRAAELHGETHVWKFAVLLMMALIAGIPGPASAGLEPGKTTVLITGANRGIGLEYVRQLSQRDWNIIATARDPSSAAELQQLGKTNPQIVIEKLDVTDHAGIDALAAKYKAQPIDILLLNAGLTPSAYPSAFKPLAGVDMHIARQSFEVNALAPLKMCQAFMDNVARSAKKQIIVMASKGGSFAESPKFPMMYEYRASKAALDMFMYTLAFETPKRGVTVTLLSPGQVNTAPGEAAGGIKRPGTIEASESVTKMLKVIDSLTPADNGKFLNYEERREIPW